MYHGILHNSNFINSKNILNYIYGKCEENENFSTYFPRQFNSTAEMQSQSWFRGNR